MIADAVIIGGGPAGCAAALGLARAGGHVVICERTRVLALKPGEILEASIRIPLKQLGIAEAFGSLHSLMLAGSLSVWDDESPIEVCGMLNAFGHGVLVDRRQFDMWLVSAATTAGVHVLRANRWSVSINRSRWEVACSCGTQSETVRAPIVIEASGRSNGILGFGRKGVTDCLVALLTYGFTHRGSRDQQLLIEACEYGWWYAAPLPSDMAVIAFMTDADLVPPAAVQRREFVSSQLRKTTIVRQFADGMHSCSRLLGFPANSGIRQTINGANWVSIGDAASTYDPLSGVGIAAALSKGAAVARIISDSRNLPHALGNYADAERAVFSDYLAHQKKTYRRAARRFTSPFWSRRAASVALVTSWSS
jgi:flavin-dependent dehydrogenase